MTMLSLLILVARGAIVLACAVLGVRLLRGASASVRHAMLASAFAAVLALPLIAVIVPVWHAGAIGANAGEPAGPVASPVAEPAASAGGEAPAVASRPAGDAPVPWAAIAAAVWAFGASVLLARIAIGAVRARRIAARGTPAAGADAYIAELWHAERRPPRVVVSDEISAPIVVGAFAPVVVVPRASADWSRERWRVVLLHELAHVRRRDVLAGFVAQVACALHWCDPFAWLAARSMREERELAADDAVLRDGARASMYAEHLVAIAYASIRPAPAGALAMASPTRFEARLIALLDRDRSRTTAGVQRTAAVTVAIGFIAAVAACVSPEAAPRHADEPSVTAKDPALQSATEAELDSVMAAQHATGAVAVVLDAKTGTVLAMASRGNVDARAPRTTGSTLKPFVFAAALDAGVVDPAARIDCEHGARTYGDKTLHDASPNGVLDLGGILAVSSNVCTAKLAEPLGDRLGESLRRFHFAAPAHVDTRSFEGAAIAAGEGIRVSALELAAGYTAFADDGIYHAPDGTSSHVMKPETAHAVMTMLERVVNGPEGTGHGARIDGVKVAGKTGTAETGVDGRYYASFVGIVPADAPRVIVLVGVDGVTGAGGAVAAPAFAKIAARALQ